MFANGKVSGKPHLSFKWVLLLNKQINELRKKDRSGTELMI